MAKTGQKLIFICLVLSNPRNFGNRNSENTNIFLKCGCKVGAGGGLLVCLFACPLVQRWAGLRGFRTSLNAGAGPLVVCSVVFVRFAALLLVRCLQIWLYFAF